MKYLLVLSILLPLSYFTQCDNCSIIHYTDGSIFIGEITKGDKGQLQLVNVYGDTLTLSYLRVKKIRKADRILLAKNRKFHFKKGYFGDFKYAFDGGFNSDGRLTSLRLGKRYTPQINAGVELGILHEQRILQIPSISSTWLWIDQNILVLNGFGQYYFSDKGIRPYGNVTLGYGFAMSRDWGTIQEQKGGLHARLALGLDFASRKNSKYFVELYQLIQKSSGEGTSFMDLGNPVSYAFDVWAKRIGFSVGIRFL